MDLANELTDEITNNTDFLISALLSNNVSASDIRAVKSNYTTQVSNQVNNVISKISSQIQGISNTQVGIYQYYRKLDLICSATDGKITSVGSPYVYTLTGLPDGTSDTLTTIRTDYIKLASDVQTYYSLLNSNNIILNVTTPSTTFTPISNQTFTNNLNKFLFWFAFYLFICYFFYI